MKTKVEAYKATMVDPATIIIIGLDTPDREDHPLYDERVHLPLDPEMLANVQQRHADGQQAILQAVLLRVPRVGHKDDRCGLVAGRQRVRWARAAGCLVPVHPVSGSDADMIAIMTAENDVRREDNHMIQARKADRLMAATDGTPDEKLAAAAAASGCSKGTIRARLALLSLSPVLQTSVELGEIAMYDAIALKELTWEKQEQAAAAKAEAKGRGEKAARVEGERARPATRPGKREVDKLARKLGGTAQVALMWAIGEMDDAAANEDAGFAAALLASRSKTNG